MNKIIFSAPSLKKYNYDLFSNIDKNKFWGISITGEKCGLNCSHCNSILLKYMLHAPSAELLEKHVVHLIENGATGFLITGGCDRNGKLPLSPFTETLKTLKDKFKITLAFHTRLVDETLAANFDAINADTILIDITGSDEVLKNVYNLKNKTINDELASLDLLQKYHIPISPHIVIGINYGKIDGEYQALEVLKGRDFKTLVLVVIKPLKGSQMEKIDIPHLNDVFKIMTKAREFFPDKKITLGCARPYGEYQKALEHKAIELNFSGIAYPSEEIINYCINNNYQIEYSYSCCGI